MWQRHTTRAPACASGAARPSGLRVVQQHHITGPDPGDQLHRVRGQHLRVVIGLRRAERAAGQVAVDLVVQPLGDREEPGVAGDHQPADRDVQILDVPDQYLQHLGDPATGRGRVDIPDGAPGQHVPDQVRGPGQQPVPRSADDRLQQRHRPPRHLHGSNRLTASALPPAHGRAVGQGVACPLTCPSAQTLRVNHGHSRKIKRIGAGHCSQKSLVALAGQTSVALGT